MAALHNRPLALSNNVRSKIRNLFPWNIHATNLFSKHFYKRKKQIFFQLNHAYQSQFKDSFRCIFNDHPNQFTRQFLESTVRIHFDGFRKMRRFHFRFSLRYQHNENIRLVREDKCEKSAMKDAVNAKLIKFRVFMSIWSLPRGNFIPKVYCFLKITRIKRSRMHS